MTGEQSGLFGLRILASTIIDDIRLVVLDE